ncbi:helix-turn-helix transcriptional regulator [Halomontanus rarus]|uniref:helix-turn-helix transcriptional regulator n=1 Tax=Halomontanus rarus TaxID=3034020 RepID=UPI0023E8E76F|nr:hypothetical protein [Halovivax sp. TS33]
MRLSTALTLTLIALLLVFPVGVIGAPSAFATSSASVAADSQPHVYAQSSQEPTPDDPRQVFTIRLTADGNAEWTVESRYLLEDDEIEEFHTFAESVTSGDRDLGYDETFERFRSIAQNGVDREMELTNASWDEPRVENASEVGLEIAGETETETETNSNIDVGDDHRVGIISYSFTWTNFTEKDGNRIYLGDVFQHGDGTWFSRLDDGQRLVIERPPNYGYDDHDHSLTNGKLVWNGPHEFDIAEFSVTYLEGAAPPGTPAAEDSIFSRATLGFGLFVLLALVGAGGYFVARRSSTDSETDNSGGTAGAEAEAVTDDSSTTETDAGTGAAGVGSAAATDDGAEAQSTTAYDETDSPRDVDLEDDVDLELLSDEERVHRLLRRNSGRMKQASIVKETGWSNAKVSQLLSKMDEDGEIEKLRIGRENLITHPEVDPTEIE